MTTEHPLSAHAALEKIYPPGTPYLTDYRELLTPEHPPLEQLRNPLEPIEFFALSDEANATKAAPSTVRFPLLINDPQMDFVPLPDIAV